MCACVSECACRCVCVGHVHCLPSGLMCTRVGCGVVGTAVVTHMCCPISVSSHDTERITRLVVLVGWLVGWLCVGWVFWVVLSCHTHAWTLLLFALVCWCGLV